MKIQRRILGVILFLSEFGLVFFGFSNHIGNPENGNIFGIIELLSKYDKLCLNLWKKIANHNKVTLISKFIFQREYKMNLLIFVVPMFK